MLEQKPIENNATSDPDIRNIVRQAIEEFVHASTEKRSRLTKPNCRKSGSGAKAWNPG